MIIDKSVALTKGILGINRPLLVEVISNIEEALGDVVPIPTWACNEVITISKKDVM